MKIDLHIHSREGSDGKWPLKDIFAEAARRDLKLISITDHDSIAAQAEAMELARQYGMHFLTGVEFNVTYTCPEYKDGKPFALDFLGYGFDIRNAPLQVKLEELRSFREKRATKILENLNREFQKEGLRFLTSDDLEAIQATVDGAFGRPHIANYLVQEGVVRDRQEAFDRYLLKCNVAKLPLSLGEASGLIKGAGGSLFLAHPADPNGTSLNVVSEDPARQQQIISHGMLDYIDGIECWHSRLSPEATASYGAFAKKHRLLVSGGTDCHQQPVMIGDVDVPDLVAEQFGFV